VKVTCDLCIAKSISKADAQRLICFTNNSGPLFIISTVGVCLLNNQNYGLIILLLHYASALTTGIILSRTVKSCPLPAKDTTPPSFGTLVTTAVSDGMETIAKIGGYIILFSVLVKITELVGFTGLISYILSPFGVRSDYVKALTAAFFEVTNGCSALCKLPHSVLLCAAALSWGGLSIHAQSIGFIKKAGLKITPYILCRILQTATTLIYGIAFSIITGYPL
jgi:sporulation integral membrane protein YlbJ